MKPFVDYEPVLEFAWLSLKFALKTYRKCITNVLLFVQQYFHLMI